RGINASGQVVGGSATPTAPNGRGFLYSGGTMIDLGSLSGPTGDSTAYGINAAGQIVGDTSTFAFQYHAFLYSNGAMADLGTLGGPHEASHAHAINASGQVTGFSSLNALSEFHAFLYSNGVMADLGTLNDLASIGNGINDHGVVVGDIVDLNDSP